MKYFFLLCIMVLSFVGCGTARLTPEQKAVKTAWVVQKVHDAIDHKALTVEMNYVIPFRAGMKHLDYGYDIRLSGDTLYSYLPYYGRVYSIPYGGGKGLIFNAPVQDYVVSYPKKGMTQMHVFVQNEEDQFVYMLDIFDNGHVDLQVRTREREQISFSGELVIKDENEK